jgi:hypothetical protein
MKVTYYSKIEHLKTGLYLLTFPDFPTIEITENSIDQIIKISKLILKSFLLSLPDLPEEISYIGEEYYPIVVIL